MQNNAILQSKAFTINNRNFREPYFAPDVTVYADTASKAKSKILSKIKYDECKDIYGEIINFITLRVMRAKSADKYLVDGQLKTLHDIEYDRKVKEKNERLDLLVAQNPNAKAFIKKGGSYYCSNYCGYTERKTEAGIYSIEDAVKSAKGCSLGDYMDVVILDPIEHNKMINDKINELKSKLI